MNHKMLIDLKFCMDGCMHAIYMATQLIICDSGWHTINNKNKIKKYSTNTKIKIMIKRLGECQKLWTMEPCLFLLCVCLLLNSRESGCFRNFGNEWPRDSRIHTEGREKCRLSNYVEVVTQLCYPHCASPWILLPIYLLCYRLDWSVSLLF